MKIKRDKNLFNKLVRESKHGRELSRRMRENNFITEGQLKKMGLLVSKEDKTQVKNGGNYKYNWTCFRGY